MATIDFAGSPGHWLGELRNATRPPRRLMAGRRRQRQALSGIVEDPLAKQVSNPQASRKMTVRDAASATASKQEPKKPAKKAVKAK